MSKSTKSKVVKQSNKSKKYLANQEKVQAKIKETGQLSIADAVSLLFELDQPNYKEGPTVELHAKLGIDPTKSDQLVRSSVVLPHGTGKKVVVAAFVSPENVEKAKQAGADLAGGDDLIEEIKKTQKINFDKAIAEPAMMKKLPAIARLLGVAGVMPNPKTNSVGDDIEGMIKTIKAGKVDFKNDKSGNVHISCGKINAQFDVQKITENVTAALESVEKAKPDSVKKYVRSVHLTSSVSPSIKIR